MVEAAEAFCGESSVEALEASAAAAVFLPPLPLRGVPSSSPLLFPLPRRLPLSLFPLAGEDRDAEGGGGGGID